MQMFLFNTEFFPNGHVRELRNESGRVLQVFAVFDTKPDNPQHASCQEEAIFLLTGSVPFPAREIERHPAGKILADARFQVFKDYWVLTAETLRKTTSLQSARRLLLGEEEVAKLYPAASKPTKKRRSA